MITIIVSNVLEIHEVTPKLDSYLQSLATFDLSSYHVDGIPQTINLYEKYESIVKIPRGFLSLVERYCKSNNLKFNIEYDTAPSTDYSFSINPKINYKTGIYGYQGMVVSNLLSHTTTRLDAPTASGKTVIACLLMGLLNKGPILFLADKDRLIRQFINTVEKVLQIPREEIGIIKAQKNIIKPITVGSLRTLGKENFNIAKLKNTFHVVFFDECHISSALTYRRVLLNLAPQYLYGLSATPEHYASDEINRLMLGLLGDIGVTIKEDQIPDRIYPEIVIRETGCKFRYNVDKNSPDWYKHKAMNRLYNDIADCEERNKLIVKDCIKLIKRGKCKLLITTKRVSHAQTLANLLKQQDIKVSFPYTFKITKKGEEQSKVNHKQLDLDVEEIERGNIDALVGTYTLFQTGFDCTPLSGLIFAAPFSGINTTINRQSVGRIQRHYFDKDRAVVVDYRDQSYPNDVLDFWSTERYETLIRFFEK